VDGEDSSLKNQNTQINFLTFRPKGGAESESNLEREALVADDNGTEIKGHIPHHVHSPIRLLPYSLGKTKILSEYIEQISSNGFTDVR
jgi:hypothetical protein